METPLAKVRGLGPAGHGGGDWWAVRLNSAALLLLSVWLVASLLRLPDLSYPIVQEWLRDRVAEVWHIQKGLREVIDDYAHDEGGRVFWITLLAFFVYGGGALAAFCVLKVALGGSGG
jgi:succinate dehydrogenase / fumarate reductase, membrane anchor subunit